MTAPVFYILVALTLTSAMISVIFFIAWRYLGRKPYALSWSVGFLAATAQWLFNLGASWFPSHEVYWLTINGLALVLITLGLRGHCQRTDCKTLPKNLWPYAAGVYAVIVWTAVVDPHVGVATALVPSVAALALFLSSSMILRHREQPRPAEYAAAWTMIVLGLTQVAAAGLGLLQGAEGDDRYYTLYIHFYFLTLPAGYTGMAMFVILMLASDLSEQMKEDAIRDQLTGLLNRRGFNECSATAYATARRTGRPVSVVMTDIDRFKYINDEFGHAAGDLALCRFAETLRQLRRAEDILARVGGEEFAIVLPGTSVEDANTIAEDLCARVEANTVDLGEGEALPMTASFGVATLSEKDSCLSEAIVRADRALYRSKRAGRNRVDLEASQVLRTIDGELKPI